MNNLELQKCILGPVYTNCYFLKNKVTGEMIIIDPADGTRKSLAAGMNLSCNGTSLGITKIRKAPSKH